MPCPDRPRRRRHGRGGAVLTAALLGAGALGRRGLSAVVWHPQLARGVCQRRPERGSAEAAAKVGAAPGLDRQGRGPVTAQSPRLSRHRGACSAPSAAVFRPAGARLPSRSVRDQRLGGVVLSRSATAPPGLSEACSRVPSPGSCIDGLTGTTMLLLSASVALRHLTRVRSAGAAIHRPPSAIRRNPVGSAGHPVVSLAL